VKIGFQWLDIGRPIESSLDDFYLTE